MTHNISEQKLKAHNIYWAAVDTSDSNRDVIALADEIIATGDAAYICSFASDVDGAPIDKLADAIISIGDIFEIKRFMEHVKGAPIKKLKAAADKIEKETTRQL